MKINKIIPVLTIASASCCAIVPTVACSNNSVADQTNFLEWDATKGVWEPKISCIDLTPFQDVDAMAVRYFDDIEKNNLILCEDYMYRFYSGNICGVSMWDYVSILVKEVDSEKQTISVEFTANGWTQIDDVVVYTYNVIDFNNFKMKITHWQPTSEQYNTDIGFCPVNSINLDGDDVDDWINDKEWNLTFESNRCYVDGKRDTYKYESNSSAVSELTEFEDKQYFLSLVDLMWTGSLYMGGAYIDD